MPGVTSAASSGASPRPGALPGPAPPATGGPPPGTIDDLPRPIRARNTRTRITTGLAAARRGLTKDPGGPEGSAFGRVTDGLDVVAVRIAHERAVVGRV